MDADLTTWKPTLRTRHLYSPSTFLLATHYDPERLWDWDPFRTWWIGQIQLKSGRWPEHVPPPPRAPRIDWQAVGRWAKDGAACDFAVMDRVLTNAGLLYGPDTLDPAGWLVAPMRVLPVDYLVSIRVRARLILAHQSLEASLTDPRQAHLFGAFLSTLNRKQTQP